MRADRGSAYRAGLALRFATTQDRSGRQFASREAGPLGLLEYFLFERQ